jgi:hypothetical protein
VLLPPLSVQLTKEVFMLSSFVNRLWKSTPLLLLLGQIAGLILMTEQTAQAYVDPGTGLVSLQVLGASVAAWFYVLRRRLRLLLGSPRSRLRGSQHRPNAVATSAGGDSSKVGAERR